MPSKQVEDVYNATRQANARAEPVRQELFDELSGYGEGVIHGWEAAAKAVSEATNGLFTLQETREVSEWRARLKRSKR